MNTNTENIYVIPLVMSHTVTMQASQKLDGYELVWIPAHVFIQQWDDSYYGELFKIGKHEASKVYRVNALFMNSQVSPVHISYLDTLYNPLTQKARFMDGTTRTKLLLIYGAKEIPIFASEDARNDLLHFLKQTQTLNSSKKRAWYTIFATRCMKCVRKIFR